MRGEDETLAEAGPHEVVDYVLVRDEKLGWPGVEIGRDEGE